MAIPAGVTLATVRIPASAIWSGGPSMITATLKPVRLVFHRATGELFAPVTTTVQGPGTGLALLVPHSDQSGYRDEDGNSITGWEYDVLVKFRDVSNFPVTLRKRILIPRGTADVDLIAAPYGARRPVLPWEQLDQIYFGSYLLRYETDAVTGRVVETQEEGVITKYTYNANGSVATSLETSMHNEVAVTYSYTS